MAPTEQRRATSALLWLAALALVFTGIYGIRSMTRTAVQVKVTAVSYQNLSDTDSTNGRVEPVTYFQAHAPVAGVVRKIYVSEGDHVNAGQLLIKMDDADIRAHIATARATLSQAQLQLSQLQNGGSTEELSQFHSNTSSAQLEQQQATLALAAIQQLQQKGSASASEVAAAQQRVNAANLALQNASTHTAGRYNADDVANAQARVADARATLQAAQASLTAADIHSPLSGTVYSIPVSEYDFVHDGDDLMDVADLKRIQVRAYFDEPEIGKLQDGQPALITWDAEPGSAWHGHILHVPTTIITYGQTRNVGECIISVDDAHGDLPPNSTVLVKVTELSRDHVLSIPHEALHTDGARNYVFRILNGHLEQTPVRITSLVTTTDVEIAGGLNPGDMVVLGPVTPGTELSSGLSVRPVK